MAYSLYHTQQYKQGESYTPEAVSHRPQRLEEKKRQKKAVNYIAQDTSWYSRQAERATVSEVIRHGV